MSNATFFTKLFFVSHSHTTDEEFAGVPDHLLLFRTIGIGEGRGAR